jgi:hypothetical protein
MLYKDYSDRRYGRSGQIPWLSRPRGLNPHTSRYGGILKDTVLSCFAKHSNNEGKVMRLMQLVEETHFAGSVHNWDAV